MIATPADYVFQRQTLWAHRHGHKLRGSAGDRGRRAYTDTLDDNLFEPLSPDSRADFAAGDGGELGKAGPIPGKMQAVHSSSALSCNLFHYWQRIGRPDIVAKACGLPDRNVQSLAFEQHLPIDPKFRFTPNLDALFAYSKGAVRRIGVECKFCEAFSTRALLGLKEKYLETGLDDLWSGMPHVQALARELSPANKRYDHLDAAQLVKHVLGLRRCSDSACRLLYLYYDMPGSAGAKHAEEIADFIEVTRQDGIVVTSATYQDVLLWLARTHRADHAAYIDYMVERYL